MLKPMFGAMIRVSERWKSIRVTEFERRYLRALRRELNGEHETDRATVRGPDMTTSFTGLSSRLQT